jgi:hypothetical protein
MEKYREINVANVELWICGNVKVEFGNVDMGKKNGIVIW